MAISTETGKAKDYPKYTGHQNGKILKYKITCCLPWAERKLDHGSVAWYWGKLVESKTVKACVARTFGAFSNLAWLALFLLSSVFT